MYRLKGVQVVYFFIFILTVLSACVFSSGVHQESLLDFLHYTGRLGLFLLVLSFGISSLNVLLNSSLTKYFMRNRRYYGISFSVVMVVHFVAVTVLQFHDEVWFKENIALWIYLLGLLGIVVSAVMGVTSNNWSVRKLGIKKWKNVHLVCGYIITVLYLIDYLALHNTPNYWPLGVLAVSLVGVRLAKNKIIVRQRRLKEL